ncbi:hypothetical protein [Marinactinospora rubrisoli]|uniref:Uncharacterized protein n=1 Tax=Marinactinospora rubrisoli TaxID=2715399 RepID=A0ABW2KIB2_9ACTN
MPVSPAVRDRVRGFLPVDATIRYLFPASWHETSHFLIAVTDTSVVVLSTALFRRTRPKRIWRVFPREVRLGPVDTHLIPTFELGGHHFEVDEEYITVINAADAELGDDRLPRDPFADL